MSTPSVLTLSPLNSLRSLITSLGGELPSAVEEAFLAHQTLRRQRPAIPGSHDIGTTFLDVSEAKAVEDLLHARAALEAHSAAVEVSGHRTTALMFKQRDEIVSAALSSPEVKTRARDISKFAKAIDPAVSGDLRRILDPEDLIAASHLLKAESVLRNVGAKLDGVLGADFDPLPLLWIDPTGVTDWVAFDKALKGIRYGHTYIPVWELGPTGAPGISTNAMGIVSASASGVPGTRFTLATSYTEYERRRSVYERALGAMTREATERAEKAKSKHESRRIVLL